MKVLIVEDNIQTAMQYQLALEERNHDVVVTHNGEEGCDAYTKAFKATTPEPNNGAFDVVVLDYRLPVKNGIQVAKKITTKNPKQKIIFATGHLKEILSAEVKDPEIPLKVIEKPFELDEFVDKIETFVSA
ncbi:MAG: response regulator [Thaumarchaeota archaeon]|nr:response regulator [Nitrososphaerota archaeon]